MVVVILIALKTSAGSSQSVQAHSSTGNAQCFLVNFFLRSVKSITVESEQNTMDYKLFSFGRRLEFLDFIQFG